MDITPAIAIGRQTVESYGGGRFRISGQIYEGSVLVLPGRTFSWAVGALDEVSLDSLEPLLAEGQGILLLGCGPRLGLVPVELREGVRAHGFVLEPMDTGAACRTYNVLVTEERRVAAALIAVE